jgi:hypothetical protein
MNKGSTPDSIFVLYFGVTVFVLVLVRENGQYCQQYLDTSDSGPSAVPGSSQSDMLVCLAIIVQMGHYIVATVLGHSKQWTVCSAWQQSI